MRSLAQAHASTCVLLSSARYEAMLEEIENLRLIIETDKRLDKAHFTYTEREIMNRHGITESDLAGWEDAEVE